MDDTVDRAVRTEIVRQQDDALRSMRRGVALILFVPIVMVATIVASALLDSFGPVLLGACYTLIGGTGGVVVLALAIAKHRLAARELRELDSIRQLPVARVVR